MAIMREMTVKEKENYNKLIAGAEQMTAFNIYGYCRISRKEQSIERQIRNIMAEYPSAKIYTEAYTGRSMNRPEWEKLCKRLIPGDCIVFDSVSRLSRSAEEGAEIYFNLFEKGIQLIFLKEHYIDTATYQGAIQQTISNTGNDIADIYIAATNEVIKLLAKKQIIQAFEQAEKEVEDLRQRTREGLITAKAKGKRVGAVKGEKFTVKKKEPMKAEILKYSKNFNGSLNDIDCMKITGLARNTYYKYKKELRKRYG